LVRHILLLFSTLLCVSCESRYSDYAELREWEAQIPRSAHAVSEIRPIEHRVWVSPDDGNGDMLAARIDGAKRAVDLNVYLLSDTKLVNSLISARRRNLPVRVILERSPYENPKGNADMFARLANEGILVGWADETRQNFNHAKYVLADDVLYLATSNFTATSFAKNREFLVETPDVPTVGFMKRLFEADFQRFPFRGSQENAYLSPTDSRIKLESHLRAAKTEVRLFAASLSDESLL
jgi:phosphatidylserine/phosphatidylglycerophosphate/cardiolipin synthase-like enzyme